MVLVGACIALATGIAYNVAAALQKREAVQVQLGTRHLLGRLMHRKVWVIATALSGVAWVGQVAALALAPVALVVPLLSIGSAVLVVLGVRYLHERFRRAELAGVVLVVAGASAAGVAEAGVAVSHLPLGFATQLVIAGVAVAGAMSALRWRSATAYGVAAGCGFSAVAIYSKEIGDAFAVRGFAAVPHVLGGPALWLLAVIATAAITLQQAGFQRGNAASVVAALAVPEAIGPLIAGFVLYHERYPGGVAGAVLVAGLACVLTGSVLLARYGRALGEEVAARA